jgi:hypothetical protein
MDTTYYYHSYFKTIARKLPVFTMTLIVLCWLPTLWVYLAIYHNFYFPLIRLSLNGSMMVVFVTLLMRMILRELNKTVFIITDDAFIKKTPYKIKTVYFDQIIRFRYVRFFWFKGFGKIDFQGGSIQLPFIIQDLSRCIVDIEDHLSLRGKQRVYENDEIRLFKKKAMVSDVVIARASALFPTVSRISFWLMFISGLIARYYWGLPLRWVFFWSLCGFVFPYAGFLASLTHVARKLERGMDKSTFSLPIINEMHLYRLYGLMTLVLYFSAGVLFKKLVYFAR